MAETPSIRASDAERELTAQRLRTAGEEGRLDMEELEERLDRAYKARTMEDLDVLTTDLPRKTGMGGRAPETARRHSLVRGIEAYVPITVILIAVWAASGMGYFWPIWPMIGFAMAIFGVWGGPPGRGRHRDRARRAERRGGLPPPPEPPAPPPAP
jgi:hypothetical protein